MQFINTKYDENKILDKPANEIICGFAKNYLLNIIKNTLTEFGVEFDI
jgi:hypothetical protein